MKKPYGVEEFDGYPMPRVPKNRRPLTKEEEAKIGAELRENILKNVKITKVIADEEETERSRKIG